MRTRIGRGDVVSLMGAALLIVSLFLPWYSLTGTGVSVSADAFQAFRAVDIVLLVIGALAIVIVLALAAGAPWAAHRATVLGGGVVALVLVLFAMIRRPGDMGALPAAIRADVGLAAGVVVGLVATLALIAGQVMVMRRRPPDAAADISGDASA